MTSTISAETIGRRHYSLDLSNKSNEFISFALRPTLPGQDGTPFISLTNNAGDLVIHIELRENKRRLCAAQRIGGTWLGLVEVVLEATRLPVIEITFNEVDLVLSISGQLHSFKWPMLSTESLELDTYGSWSFARRTKLAQSEIDRLVTLHVRDAGLERTFRDDLIIDIGTNNGDDTAYYLEKGFNVVAVEANPSLCATLASRFAAEIRDGRLNRTARADGFFCK